MLLWEISGTTPGATRWISPIRLRSKRFFKRVGAFDHLALVGSGQAAWGPFADLKLDALKIAFDQKFFGFFLCVQAGLARLRRDGSITFVIGGASRSAIPETSGVAAVNGAIQAMALTLAKELAPRRVNLLSPGLVDTPVYDYMTPEQKPPSLPRWAARCRWAASASRTKSPKHCSFLYVANTRPERSSMWTAVAASTNHLDERAA